MKVIIAGGSGFIGSELIRKLLASNHQVVLLSRKPVGFKSGYNESLQIVNWNGKHAGSWIKYIDGSDAVINLSGENVASKRWSNTQKENLINSRIEPTMAIADAISKAVNKPKVFINASAAGFYGNFGDGDVFESETKGEGFLADLCEEWERNAMVTEKYGVRVVLLRIGVVLSPSGGALKKMLTPFKYFIGGPLGSGKQWFPWIHLEDVIRIIQFAIENNGIKGALNITSPNPVTMSEFAYSLGKVLKRPSLFPVPSIILKLLLGEMSEIVLGGRKIIPKKLIDAGFKFKFIDINDTLIALMKR
ncbi:MAG: TIGR01777 family protein [Ignavibacteriales bacterium]|nr:TIGR01777 family protein [Ignavibacteriales bacterium]